MLNMSKLLAERIKQQEKVKEELITSLKESGIITEDSKVAINANIHSDDGTIKLAFTVTDQQKHRLFSGVFPADSNTVLNSGFVN